MSTHTGVASTARGAEIAEDMRAVLRLFQSRRARVCAGCGEPVLGRQAHIRVRESMFHRECLPEAPRT